MIEFFLFILFFLLVIYAIEFTPRQKPRMILSFIIDHIKIKGDIDMISLKATQQQKFKIGFVDAKGNAANVEPGSVDISISDESVATVERNPDDETEFTVKAKGTGTAQLNVSADADLGEGVKPVSDFAAVEVRPGDAVGVGIQALGEPEEQPDPVPPADPV